MSYIKKQHTIYYSLIHEQFMQPYNCQPTWKSLCQNNFSQMLWAGFMPYITKSVQIQKFVKYWHWIWQKSSISQATDLVMWNCWRIVIKTQELVEFLPQCIFRDASITHGAAAVNNIPIWYGIRVVWCTLIHSKVSVQQWCFNRIQFSQL